jgi:DNA-binding transcriptional regulator YiaG
MYHYRDGGLMNVWLVNGFKVQKTPYGEGVSIEDLDGLSAAICLALTKKRSPLTGAEFRYIRSAGMKQSQAGLANLLGDNEQTVAQWEETGKAPRWADTLVRPLYLSHADGVGSIASSPARIDAIDRAKGQKILLRTTKFGWASEVA